MSQTCIVTGGAGFIGCALSPALVSRFDRVIALDTLNPNIHASAVRPARLHEQVELLVADVCDPAMWDALLKRLEPGFTLIHLAAETGTGISASQATLHAHTNVCGLTCALDSFVRNHCMPAEILLTSSRAVYGEGLWQKETGEAYYPGQRTHSQLSAAQWDFAGAQPLPQSAARNIAMPTSVYGVTKFAQEQILMVWGSSYSVPVRIARLQNVYGPGQSLLNSDTGILPLFVRQAREGKTLQLYEDGRIVRDFVYIDDVAAALICLMDSKCSSGCIFDVGTGVASTLERAAQWIARRYGAPEPVVCEKFRDGDVRHAVCDPSPAHQMLGFSARVSLEEGLESLCAWIDEELGNQ